MYANIVCLSIPNMQAVHKYTLYSQPSQLQNSEALTFVVISYNSGYFWCWRLLPAKNENFFLFKCEKCHENLIVRNSDWFEWLSLFAVLKRIKLSEQLRSINMIAMHKSLKDSIDLFRALCVQQSQKFQWMIFLIFSSLPCLTRKKLLNYARDAIILFVDFVARGLHLSII